MRRPACVGQLGKLRPIVNRPTAPVRNCEIIRPRACGRSNPSRDREGADA